MSTDLPNTDYRFQFEVTPNPHSLKFVCNQKIAAETLYITEPTQSFKSPLAHKLFGFPWMDGILISEQAVTITKQDWVEWDIIAEPLCRLLEEHLQMGLPVIASDEVATQKNKSTAPHDSAGSEIENQIQAVIDQDIRPAVQMDGGDIVFKYFDQGVVAVQMIGSCNGCPSSTQTLKLGIEARLRERIPAVQSVIAI